MSEPMIYPEELNEDLIEILGRPNFACGQFADALRADGVEIARKAEHEQAAVLHWLLKHYLRHGSTWQRHAGADLGRMIGKMHEARDE